MERLSLSMQGIDVSDNFSLQQTALAVPANGRQSYHCLPARESPKTADESLGTAPDLIRSQKMPAEL